MHLFWTVVASCSVIWYFTGHQASHLVAVVQGRAELNPPAIFALQVFQWLDFAPWIFLVWYGVKSVWWAAAAAGAAGIVLRLILVKVEMMAGLQRNAWAISLAGLVIIPLAVALIATQLWTS